MAEEAEIKSFSAIEDGATDWKTIRKNFTEIEEVLNEHARELKALARHSTFTVSMMFQKAGSHILLNGGIHPRCKPVNAFAVVHDNIDAEVRIRLVNLAQDVKFNGSEKKGSAKVFDLSPNKRVHFAESVKVELSEDRRVSVSVTFESTEEAE
ncbi:MAG: hypothetical protein FIB08_07620 [Candidatus Methanoperedens sp.]|nr:hypothetical protein [Candidatus Methanoperedens sp.]